AWSRRLGEWGLGLFRLSVGLACRVSRLRGSCPCRCKWWPGDLGRLERIHFPRRRWLRLLLRILGRSAGLRRICLALGVGRIGNLVAASDLFERAREERRREA